MPHGKKILGYLPHGKNGYRKEGNTVQCIRGEVVIKTSLCNVVEVVEALSSTGCERGAVPRESLISCHPSKLQVFTLLRRTWLWHFNWRWNFSEVDGFGFGRVDCGWWMVEGTDNTYR